MFGSKHSMSSEMQQCMEDCHQCHMTCLQMAATHCLELGGKHVEPHHMRLMLDCAEICRACAASCEEVGDMQECVDACLRCAESCERMAAVAA